jgi:hypothetical protein
MPVGHGEIASVENPETFRSHSPVLSAYYEKEGLPRGLRTSRSSVARVRRRGNQPKGCILRKQVGQFLARTRQLTS